MGRLAAARSETPGVLRGCACSRLCGSASWFRPAPPATWLPEGCHGHFWEAMAGQQRRKYLCDFVMNLAAENPQSSTVAYFSH